jgi:hypothetical protein
MHIYGDTLESYVNRDLPPAALTAIDTHVSNCVFCAHALAEEAVVSTTWERRGLLGRLVRVEGATTGDAADELDDRAAA